MFKIVCIIKILENILIVIKKYLYLLEKLLYLTYTIIITNIYLITGGCTVIYSFCRNTKEAGYNKQKKKKIMTGHFTSFY